MADLVRFLLDYVVSYTSFKTYWCYEDGCVLNGCRALYGAGLGDGFAEAIMSFYDSRISENGDISTYNYEAKALDSVNCSRQLFFAYDKSGEERFRIACEKQLNLLLSQPRTTDGSFTHKAIYPSQVWLDGLYMSLPFYAEADKRSGRRRIADIMRQFDNAHRLMRTENGLYRHAYDSSRSQDWCSAESGLSSCVWLRAIGWLMMAMVDVLELITPEFFTEFYRLRGYFRDLTKAICSMPLKDGLLFQLPELELEGNYTETSGNLMIAYAILKGCRLGFLPKELYAQKGEYIYEQIVNQKLLYSQSAITLKDICPSAGLGNGRDGSAAYYHSIPLVDSDPKAFGALMCAHAEYARAKRRRRASIYDEQY